MFINNRREFFKIKFGLSAMRKYYALELSYTFCKEIKHPKMSLQIDTAAFEKTTIIITIT